MIGEVDKLSDVPAQIFVLPEIVGADGMGFTVACKLAAGLAQPLTIATNEYVPASDRLTAFKAGFCTEDVKPFGPVHEYMAPAMEDEVRFRLAPSQTGLFDETTGAVGIGFTTTANEDEGPVQAFTVAFTE